MGAGEEKCAAYAVVGVDVGRLDCHYRGGVVRGDGDWVLVMLSCITR
jgi:hypothetical protein